MRLLDSTCWSTCGPLKPAPRRLLGVASAVQKTTTSPTAHTASVIDRCAAAPESIFRLSVAHIDIGLGPGIFVVAFATGPRWANVCRMLLWATLAEGQRSSCASSGATRTTQPSSSCGRERSVPRSMPTPTSTRSRRTPACTPDTAHPVLVRAGLNTLCHTGAIVAKNPPTIDANAPEPTPQQNPR